MRLRKRMMLRFVTFVAVVAGMLAYVSWQWGPTGHNRAAGPGVPPPVTLQPPAQGTPSSGAGAGSGSAKPGAGSGSAQPGPGTASGTRGTPFAAPRAGSAEKPPSVAAERSRSLHPAPPAQADYFTTARLDRERAQSEEIDLLKSLADNSSASSSARQAAGRKLIAVATRIRQEARAEGLLRAKGYREALVFLDQVGATAVVRAASLSETDVARIAETVSGATGVPPSRINILAEE